MKKSILTFLGRDSGFGRENNSVYVEIDDKLVIIERITESEFFTE